MKLVLTGGGTLGSVSPLIAVWQALNKNENRPETIFIGTKTGPEKKFLDQYPAIKFRYIPAGKLRRYFDLKTLLAPFLVMAGFLKSLIIFLKFRPEIVISAGGFVAVPVIWAAKLFGAKIIVHQLDIQPTLSNQLVKNIADKITVTFAESLTDYSKDKTVLAGGIIRNEATKIKQKNFPVLPKTVLVLGGGTGAMSLNKLIIESLKYLNPEIKITHVTGPNKNLAKSQDNYEAVEFLTSDYYEKIAASELVISRAGISTLLELAYFGKPTVIIPLPNSHQEKNAEFFQNNQTAIYLKQDQLTGESLAKKINSLFSDNDKLNRLGTNFNKVAAWGGENKLSQKIIDLIHD